MNFFFHIFIFISSHIYLLLCFKCVVLTSYKYDWILVTRSIFNYYSLFIIELFDKVQILANQKDTLVSRLLSFSFLNIRVITQVGFTQIFDSCAWNLPLVAILKIHLSELFSTFYMTKSSLKSQMFFYRVNLKDLTKWQICWKFVIYTVKKHLIDETCHGKCGRVLYNYCVTSLWRVT